jgi:hypothetical protein
MRLAHSFTTAKVLVIRDTSEHFMMERRKALKSSGGVIPPQFHQEIGMRNFIEVRISFLLFNTELTGTRFSKAPDVYKREADASSECGVPAARPPAPTEEDDCGGGCECGRGARSARGEKAENRVVCGWRSDSSRADAAQFRREIPRWEIPCCAIRR